MPEPWTPTEVRQVPSFTAHYMKLIPNCADLSHPLTQLTKGMEPFICTGKC